MDLPGKRIGILAEDLYEDLELWYPALRLREAGATVVVIGKPGAKRHESKHGLPVDVDVGADEARQESFDALVIPGGYAPDRMRRHADMLALVKRAFDEERVVAMICHAGWVPISAGVVNGRTVTSVSAIRDDLENAGAEWVDREVVRDANLISSRGPQDLPAFCKEIVAALSGGR